MWERAPDLHAGGHPNIHHHAHRHMVDRRAQEVLEVRLADRQPMQVRQVLVAHCDVIQASPAEVRAAGGARLSQGVIAPPRVSEYQVLGLGEHDEIPGIRVVRGHRGPWPGAQGAVTRSAGDRRRVTIHAEEHLCPAREFH